jgi:hypothetical protein
MCDDLFSSCSAFKALGRSLVLPLYPTSWDYLLQRHFHKYVRARVGHRWQRFGGHMAEADRFVEVNGVWKFCAAAQEQGSCTDQLSLGDGMLEQPAAEAMAAQMRRYGHLGKFTDTITQGHKRHTADGFGVGVNHEYVTALEKDRIYRIAERFYVLRFEGEMAGDPFFIESAEDGGIVARKEWANLNCP